jgi:hypothetical protein
VPEHMLFAQNSEIETIQCLTNAQSQCFGSLRSIKLTRRIERMKIRRHSEVFSFRSAANGSLIILPQMIRTTAKQE